MHTWFDPAMLLTQAGEPWGPGWGYHGPWLWPFMPLLGLLWLAVIAAVVWFVARGARRRERTGVDRARDILAERFARGEVSPEEYRQRLNEL